jgi:hypothetical protein
VCLQVKLKPCGGCHQVQYCSTECQREDWRAGHKAVCGAVPPREPAEGAAEEDAPSDGPEQVDEKTTGGVRASPPAAAALPAEIDATGRS